MIVVTAHPKAKNMEHEKKDQSLHAAKFKRDRDFTYLWASNLRFVWHKEASASQ